MMNEYLHHIKFDNQTKPKVKFEILKLEELFLKKLDSSPNQLHVVEFYVLLIIKNGYGYHTIDFTDYSCQRGTVLTIRKDQIHKFFQNKNLQGYLLLFTNDFLASYLEKQEALKTLQLFNEQLGVPKIQLLEPDLEEILSIVDQIRKEYFHSFDEYSTGIIRSQLHILITKLYRIKSLQKVFQPHRKYVEQFVEFQKLVEKNCFQTRKVKDYAKMMFLSTKTLNNICQSVLNKTAKVFIDEVCITHIKRLLINTNLTVKEIAYQAGFVETTNLYKYFKKFVQNTPEEFRKSYQS